MTNAGISVSKPGFSNFIESAKRALTSSNWPTICLAVGSDSSSTAKSSKPDNGKTCFKLCSFSLCSELEDSTPQGMAGELLINFSGNQVLAISTVIC